MNMFSARLSGMARGRLFAACVLLMAAGAAQAITFSFSATVGAGPFSGEVGTGHFGYDESLITGVGTEDLQPNNNVGFLFDFTILGQTFDATNDIDFANFPQIKLVDGTPNFIDVDLVQGESGVNFVNPSISEISILGDLIPGETVRFLAPITVVTTTVVPEPATIAILGAGLVGAVLRRRKLQV